MKRENKLTSFLLRKADLPRELDRRRFYLEWIGTDELKIEQHRGILSFSDNTICLQTEQGVLCVNGSELVLEHLTDASAKIYGKIVSISVGEKS